MTTRPQPVRVVANSDPIVRLIFAEMAAQQTTMAAVARISGVHKKTIGSWKTICTPNLANARAVLNALGLDLTTRRLG